MKHAPLALLLLGLPLAAHAQGMQVPGIVKADAASAAPASGAASPPPSGGTQSAPGAPLPAGWPPPVNVIGKSAPLLDKERRAVWLASRWKERREMPVAGPDGAVRYLFGSTIPTVVCAPLHICTVELQPGEVIQPPVNLGDSVRWQVTPNWSGSGLNTTTVLVIKPTDAGLATNLVVATNKRVYSIILKSTQTQWMPRTAFNYPDDVEGSWASYAANVPAAVVATATAPAAAPARLPETCFRISGDNPVWRPIRVSSEGGKTFIEFRPDAMRSVVPTLVGLVDAGWFSSDDEQKVNYRSIGNQYVVDQVIDKAALVYGVGTAQTKVVIKKKETCR